MQNNQEFRTSQGCKIIRSSGLGKDIFLTDIILSFLQSPPGGIRDCAMYVAGLLLCWGQLLLAATSLVGDDAESNVFDRYSVTSMWNCLNAGAMMRSTVHGSAFSQPAICSMLCCLSTVNVPSNTQTIYAASSTLSVG